jgi:hypothetical protein
VTPVSGLNIRRYKGVSCLWRAQCSRSPGPGPNTACVRQARHRFASAKYPSLLPAAVSAVIGEAAAQVRHSLRTHSPPPPPAWPSVAGRCPQSPQSVSRVAQPLSPAMRYASELVTLSVPVPERRSPLLGLDTMCRRVSFSAMTCWLVSKLSSCIMTFAEKVVAACFSSMPLFCSATRTAKRRFSSSCKRCCVQCSGPVGVQPKTAYLVH